jgi:lipoyl synthase
MPIPETISETPKGSRTRKPTWIRVRPPDSPQYRELKQRVDKLGLHTVCQEAHCPNIGECWSQNTLTIMILGDTCTRFCKFCNVKTGKGSGTVDSMEPENTALLLKPLDLTYVVITSVDRDDLEDGGASHFAQTILKMQKHCPQTRVETLIGDFSGSETSLAKVVAANPQVISHNLETVKRLTPAIRDPRSSYATSLLQLSRIKEMNPQIHSKSSLMLGLGENLDEVKFAMQDLRKVKVDFLTLGQYLQPSPGHHPVKRFLHPSEFEELESLGYNLGFKLVASGPLVRSSYKAGEYFINRYLESKNHDA